MANSEGNSKKTKDGGKGTFVPYQCDFKWIAKVANLIRERISGTAQLELLKTTPFWPFYNLFHSDIHSDNMPAKSNVKRIATIVSILNSYDLELDKICIGSKSLTMTAKDIAVLFGMDMKLEGEILTVPRKTIDKFKCNPFVEKYTKKGQFVKKLIEKGILETAGKKDCDNEFVQLIILYMCITIFFVNQGGNTLSIGYFEHIKDVDTINSISWPCMIFNHVMSSMKQHQGDRLRVIGCVLSFVYWVCEHTNVTRRGQRYGKQFPRVGHWSLSTIIDELPEELSTLHIDKCYFVRFTSDESFLRGTVMEEERYSSNDEEEKGSDTDEMIRLKRKCNYLGSVIKCKAHKIKKLESQVSCENLENVRGESSIISHPERLLNATPAKKHILLILDLNGLLGYFSPSKGDILLRPDCQDFVHFCLSSFIQVFFWSSMSRNNTVPAVKKILPPNSDRRGYYYEIWCQDECTQLKFQHPDDKNKPWFLKNISTIKKAYPNMLFNKTNILMVDDSPLKTVLNPANTAVFPEPWERGDNNDKALSKSGYIRCFLDGLPNEGDIGKYVRTKQPAGFGKKKADERIREVWTSTTYAGYLSELFKKQ